MLTSAERHWLQLRSLIKEEQVHDLKTFSVDQCIKSREEYRRASVLKTVQYQETPHNVMKDYLVGIMWL